MRRYFILFCFLLPVVGQAQPPQYGPQPCRDYGIATGYFEAVERQGLFNWHGPKTDAWVVAQAFERSRFETAPFCQMLKERGVKSFYFACVSDSYDNHDEATNCSREDGLCIKEYVESSCWLATFNDYYRAGDRTVLAWHRMGWRSGWARYGVDGKSNRNDYSSKHTSRYDAINDKEIRRQLYQQSLKDLLFDLLSPLTPPAPPVDES